MLSRFKDDKNLMEKMIPFYHTDHGKSVFNHLYEVNVTIAAALYRRTNGFHSTWKNFEARQMVPVWGSNMCLCPL